ncbi:acetyltransferase [Vibrio cholerae]|nr:acetyltransferase [Vibrio cholerae]MEB5561287.1 acetyltransferase [Vibrio cholerae]
MVSVVVVEFSVMRCQPLRRALCFLSTSDSKDEPDL